MNPALKRATMVSIVVAAFGTAIPTAAVEAERCQFNPNCLCLWWDNLPGGAGWEIRCPEDTGATSGWAEGTPTAEPPGIIDPRGTFRGTGRFGGGIAYAPPANYSQMRKVTGAKRALTTLLQKQPCAAFFANAPLNVDPLWLLGKIQWQDGEQDSLGICQEDPDRVAYYRFPGGHEPIIYLCDTFTTRTDAEAGLFIGHELAHVMGQSEDQTRSVGPGDAPTSQQISVAFLAACVLD